MIGLLATPGSYAVDALVAAGNLPLASVETSSIGLPPHHCSYGLKPITAGEAVLITYGWLLQLQKQGVNVAEQTLGPLRSRFNRIIALDHADPFGLYIEDDVLSQVDEVLKVNGMFHDQELYNYVVGSPTPNGRWSEKGERKQHVYSPHNLDKIRLGIPCFLCVSPPLRSRTRTIYGQSPVQRLCRDALDRLSAGFSRPLLAKRPPRHTVHFLASLTHAQRVTAVRLLQQSSLAWRGGITSVPLYISAWEGNEITTLTEDERESVAKRLGRENILAQPLNRFQYLTSISDCKAVLSITGYGEICFRMAEAWAARRVLVCQDMSHVRTLFPLVPGRNVVYCKPDLSNLIEVLEDIEVNFERYIDIAEQGYEDWKQWSSRYEDVIREGFAPLYTR